MNLDKFTPAQLQEARTYAASINRDMAAEALAGTLGLASHVDPVTYAAGQIARAESIEQGTQDHNFTIRQRMYFYLTGECVPLFASAK